MNKAPAGIRYQFWTLYTCMYTVFLSNNRVCIINRAWADSVAFQCELFYMIMKIIQVLAKTIVCVVMVSTGENVRFIRCTPGKVLQGVCQDKCVLPIIHSKLDYEFVKTAMKANKVEVIWLGLHRTWLGEFLWTDCTPASNTFNKEFGHKALNCACLNFRDQQLEAGKCHLRDKGVLCQLKGCKSCPVTARSCLKLDSTCYIRKNTLLNWENAKNFCTKFGWNLAIFPQQREENIIKELMKHYMNYTRYPRYWVALRREEWTYPQENQLIFATINTSHWAEEHPSKTGNCSVMRHKRTEYVWEAVSCKRRFKTLCLPPAFMPSQEENTNTPAQNKKLSGTPTTRVEASQQMLSEKQSQRLIPISTSHTIAALSALLPCIGVLGFILGFWCSSRVRMGRRR